MEKCDETERSSAVKDIENAITHAKTIHGYEYLKPAQEEAITSFLLGNDVFVSLPTGYGKTVIYELAPTCIDFLATTDVDETIDYKPALAVVISPLISLMEDQRMRLRSHGVKAVYLNGVDGTIPRDTAVVLASPETMLGPHGRKLLRQQGDRICGLFVDESHCIALW